MWAKALQGVPIAIVIVLMVKEAFDQIDVASGVTNRVIPVVMGFILGYYSDRARDYLDRIRDKLFGDPAPPEIEIILPEDGSISRLPKTVLRGRVTRGEVTQAQVSVNNGEPKALAVDGNGNFADVIQLFHGVENLVVVQAENAAKRKGLKAVRVKYPGAKPVVVIAAPADGAKVTAQKVVIMGTIKDAWGIPFAGRDALLLQDGAPPAALKVDERGEFSQEVELAPGSNTIRVTTLHDGLLESVAVRVQRD